MERGRKKSNIKNYHQPRPGSLGTHTHRTHIPQREKGREKRREREREERKKRE